MGNASCCVREQDSCPITKRVDRSGGKEHDNVQDYDTREERSKRNRKSRTETETFIEEDPPTETSELELAVDTNEIPSQSNRKSRKETETIYEEDLAGDTSEVYVGETFPRDEISTNFLAHISEREAADDIEEDDPSTHPSVQPTFMERSKSEMKLKENRRSLYMLDQLAASGGRLGSQPAALRKSSSCSTIYLDDSTISQPHLKNTIKCIALAIFYHISNRRNRGHERLMEIFEERLHPISRDPMPAEMMTRDPDERMIYRFVRNLFSSAMLTAECAIITLIYLERLLNYAEMDLCPSNWRRVVLASIMLASKVWDDQAVWNVDYCQILGDMNVDDMNELERRFLECLDFNINVPSSVYAKYYFDLRTLAIANDLHLPLQPLYRERAKKLEAMSQTYEDKMDALKWSFSTENLVKKAPAVLS